jgi:hypothetical protein
MMGCLTIALATPLASSAARLMAFEWMPEDITDGKIE